VMFMMPGTGCVAMRMPLDSENYASAIRREDALPQKRK